MHDDLTNLITKMKMLEDTTVEEVVVNIEETPVHPIIRAMQELREVGIIESVDPNTIFNQVKEIHRDFRDIEEGDLPDRIYWFDEYKTTRLPLSQLDLDEFGIDDRLVDEYIELIKASPNTMPPIVFDPIAGSIIDGAHRANAYAKLGYDTIPAYVGLTKSDTYGEREEIDEASGNKVAYHITPTQNLRSVMKNGLVPNIGDRSSKIAGEQSGIYLFPTVEAAEDAVMNWLGDEFDEDEPLTLLKVNINGLEKYISQGADYELIVNTSIEPNRIHKLNTQLEEASPDTLEGSFTPDLVESKEWLCEKLAKGLKGKNAGTIYVLGSWYGNMGIFLQQAGIKYDKLVLVEPDEEAIERSKKLLDPLNDDGKIVFISQKAEDIVYDKPGIIINTSCNETGPVFLTKLPDNMLCLLQARNNNDNTLFPTEHEEDFFDYFPLQTVYYTGKKDLEDPEINYVRYMIIGRSGKKTTMTNETLDSSYPYEGGKINGRYHFKTEDGVLYKVWLVGSDLVEISFSAILPGGPNKTTLTGTGNSRKVFGTVVKIVQDYIKTHAPKALYFTADGDEPSRIKLYNALMSQVDKALPDYYADKSLDLGLRSSRAYMLKKKEKQ